MDIYQLPAIDATLNAISTVFILAGYYFIKRGNQRAHKACMGTALITSTIFLACYLTYHFKAPPLHFTTPGWPKTLYFITLITHVPLALIATVMVIITVIFALKGNFEKHKRIARWTFPIWLYVSITGVLVYLMLYQWWPSTELLNR
jgi:uncharacterized membrane protein YozB (DUF420 family)